MHCVRRPLGTSVSRGLGGSGPEQSTLLIVQPSIRLSMSRFIWLRATELTDGRVEELKNEDERLKSTSPLTSSNPPCKPHRAVQPHSVPHLPTNCTPFAPHCPTQQSSSADRQHSTALQAVGHPAACRNRQSSPQQQQQQSTTNETTKITITSPTSNLDQKHTTKQTNSSPRTTRPPPPK